MRHIFVTQDFGPDRGGMARRHVELVRRFANETEKMEISTVRIDGDTEFDRGEHYRINRQPFHFREANRFTNQLKWARWLKGYSESRIDVIHCGNIRPAGYGVLWTMKRLGIPYIVYVNGGDLLRETQKAQKSALKRRMSREILGNAAGIAATSQWVADLTSDVMSDVGVLNKPPVAALALGTDPVTFSPSRDKRQLRAKWGIGNDAVILTVARLVPHKGQDVIVRALPQLLLEFPGLKYVMVGEGHDETRLRAIAVELGVESSVIFAGPVSEDDLPEAYATATIYAGPSRVDNEINVEGFGISFLEASSSGLPVVAGDSGGVRSAVHDGETGAVLPPRDVDAWVATIGELLRNDQRRRMLGAAGRKAVEDHFNWDRVARDTRDFTLSVTRGKKS